MYTEAEQKEHRQTLISALRSGEYSQVKRILHNENGYCCLGVACDLSKIYPWHEIKLVDKVFYRYGTKYSSTLPLPVMNYYGFESDVGFLIPEIKSSLTELNDKGFSFDQIADVIEWWYYED